MATVLTEVEERIRREEPRYFANGNGNYSVSLTSPETHGQGYEDTQKILAVFCYENPETVVGRYVRDVTLAMVKRNIPVHVFSRHPYPFDASNVHTHPVGDCEGSDLLGSVHEFTRRASNAYLREFHASRDAITIMGYEWSSIPTLSLLHGIKNVGALLSLHSLERQRSLGADDLSRRIAEIEVVGLRESRAIFVQDSETGEVAKQCYPGCAGRIVDASPIIPIHAFEGTVDPGAVKACYQVGPVDPTVLYVGDLSEDYGPDMLMKAMPRVLRRNPQVRGIFVGYGEMYWPLRVFSRYLLLDHAVRMVGDLQGQPLYDLIQAADIVVVPSRQSTPWWPILTGWAAKRPVIATREAAAPLLEHEIDCIVSEPDETELAQCIVDLLQAPDLMQTIAENGRAKLQERCNMNVVANQIEEMMRIQQSQQEYVPQQV